MDPDPILCRWRACLAARGTPVLRGEAGDLSAQALLAGCDAAAARPGDRAGAEIALFEADIRRFVTRLLAGWFAGQRVLALPDENATVPLDGEPCRPGSPLLAMLTSGSTGRPVRVMKQLAQLDQEVTAIEAMLGEHVAPDTLVAATVPHQHYYGFMFRLLWPLLTGRPAHEPALRFPDAIERFPPGGDAMLVSSPALLRALAALGQASLLRERFRLVLSAGSRLDPAVADAITSAGVTLVDLFGSTEAGATATRRPPSATHRPLPGVEWRIDAASLLEIRAPYAGSGDWMATGDRARAVEDGFELLGRADRVAKVADQRVSLDAVEDALRATGLVEAVRALALDDAVSTLAAVVVPNDAGSTRLARLGAFGFGRDLRALLAPTQPAAFLPKRWRFVAALPENALGKTRVATLQALLCEPVLWPTVLARTIGQQAVTLTLHVDPALPCFEGHFPGMPIVPGVAQLDWAVHFGLAHCGVCGDFSGMDVLKFHRVIAPGARVTLRLAWQEAQGILEFAYESAHPHSSGRLRFAP